MYMFDFRPYSTQVPPAEIETTLLKHPSVLDAGVVGVPHPVSGEVPVAFVVKSGPVTEAELVKFVAERVRKRPLRYKNVFIVKTNSDVPVCLHQKIKIRICY